MTLGTVFLIILAVGSLIFFEIVKSVPEEGKWAQPKYVALEVVILCVVIFVAITIWGSLT